MQPESPQPAAQPEEPPVKPKHDPDLEMLEPGEHVVTVVHRHPIGIVAIYIETLVGIFALFFLARILAPDFFSNLSGQAYRLFLAAVLLAVVLFSLILFVATYIYRQSRLIVSDKSLIQVIQSGLFVRKVSRLSMSNVQDVTAEHNGFLPTIFGYGTLTVETAGEEDNFVFKWCPMPDNYAERILDARQKYVQSLDAADRAAG